MQIEELQTSLLEITAPHSRSVTPVMTSEEPGSSYTTEVEQTRQSISEVDVGTALLARIELLESETEKLKEAPKRKHLFNIEDIQHDDKMILFYTGFVSLGFLVPFSSFLDRLLIT